MSDPISRIHLPKGKLSIRQHIFQIFYPLWSKNSFSVRLKKRRLKKILSFFQTQTLQGKRVLEIGCANGQDFILHLKDPDIELYGLDFEDYKIKQDNFTFINGDAEKIDYPEKYFDYTISIGVLEHIQPVEKLSRVISEIARVSKSYCMIVPSVGTIFEPHTAMFLWQIRDSNKKPHCPLLNFYSDEAWKQFIGFTGCKTKRFWYLPLFIQNLAIYKMNF